MLDLWFERCGFFFRSNCAKIRLVIVVRIIGIDPGLAIVGYGILDYEGNHFDLVAMGAIKTPKNYLLPKRLLMISEEMKTLLDLYEPDEMAIEELFFNKNITTGISVSHARGVEILEAVKKGIPIYEYTPFQVKQSVTGYGKAEKRQVEEMVKLLLNLKKRPELDDTADALAIAICHGHSLKFKEEFRLG